MKNKKIKKIPKIFLVFAVLLITFSVSATAFGIGSTSAFNLEPGESQDTTFSLMNKGSTDKDMTIKATITDGQEYISLPEGDIFDVPAGTVKSVKATISVPEDARIGDKYSVTITFSPTSGGSGSEGGTVDIAFGYERTFDINVISRTGEKPFPTTTITLILLALIILVIIIIRLVLKRKNNQTTQLKSQLTKTPPTTPSTKFQSTKKKSLK